MSGKSKKSDSPVTSGDVKEPWSMAFSKTAALPMAFTVKSSFEDRFSEAFYSLGRPQHDQLGVFSTWYWATPLLDGYVLVNSTEGFPAGKLPSGVRVVGTRPLRLMCHLLGLTQPRRFACEVEVPAMSDLLDELLQQQENGTESLDPEDRSMLFVSDASELTVLTYKLFGEAALPNVIPYQARRSIPADGEWGAAGFSMFDKEILTREHVSLDDAILWRPIAGPHLTAGFMQLGCSIDDVKTWIDAGCTAGQAHWLMDHGVPLEDAREWIDAGGHPTGLLQARDRGITVDQVRPFLSIGVSDLVAIDLAEHEVPVEVVAALFEEIQPGKYDNDGLITTFALNHIDPPMARRWLNLEISSYYIMLALRKDISLEELESKIASGSRPHQLSEFIEKKRN